MRERERGKEQNEKIPDPSIHPIYLLPDFACLFASFFFLLPVFFLYLTLPCLTLSYCTAVYLDRILVFELELELELELGFEVR